MTFVVRSPGAEYDLEDIWLTIATDNPQAATRIIRAIGARIDQLSDHPRLGPRRKDIHPTARLLIERSYFILYQTDPDTDEGPIHTVEIIRVVDGRRDLTSLL